MKINMKKSYLNFILALLVLSVSYSAHAIKLPKTSSVPGGIAVVPLGIESINPPIVKYQDKRVMVAPDPKKDKHW